MGGNVEGQGWRSIRRGGYLDRHPILVPATVFALAWIPYVAVFFRRTIAFGDLGGAFPVGTVQYWGLFALQLGVCVISHSLTLRTIIRLYAPRWLIAGSIAFFALSPTWGLLTAADIRHPLFAAVFCVLVSSTVFVLYGRRTAPWVWVQLAGGALAVCLLRNDGVAVALAALALVAAYEIRKRAVERQLSRGGGEGDASAASVPYLAANPAKHRESRWSDVDAAFLVLTAVGLLSWLTLSLAGGLPLGQPGFGANAGAGAGAMPEIAWGANLTGTDDVAGVIPYAELVGNSMLPDAAQAVARVFLAQQCLPLVNLTFSWATFDGLFAAFLAWAALIALRGVRRDAQPQPSEGSRRRDLQPQPGEGQRQRDSRSRQRDWRPLIVAVPMAIIIAQTFLAPGDATLRFILPVLAAQPMLFASCFFSTRRS